MSSRVDEAFLARNASHTDSAVEERTFFLESGGERCFAILYLPTGERRDDGYVVCHSYGDEFQNLRRTERAAARSLAATGSPVLRVDRRGFGDSQGSTSEATLERQLDDIGTALGFLVEETGVGRQGLVGSRFGALLAGLIAREDRVERLILLNPAVRGEPYLKHLIKQTRIAQLSASANSGPRPMADLMRELEAKGMLNIIAHPLYRHLYEDVRRLDLGVDMGSFTGAALVVQATKGATVPEPVEAFSRAVATAGGTCDVTLVEEPRGVAFGQVAIASTTDPVSREYLYEPLDARIAAAVREWASR
jgi:pimeloyl-ACP methyl ester carboxylesterase